MRYVWTCLCLSLLLTPLAFGQGGPGPVKLSASRLANADNVRRQLGLLPAYANLTGLRSVRIAVLDHGFEGVGVGRPYLPADTVVVEHYDPEFVRRFNLGDPAFQKPFVPGNTHGRSMAQLVWAMTGNSPHGPHFYLLNANGPTLFRRAVRYAIEQKVDIILFSEDFEGGGNYDGRGSINAIVDDAIAAGIIWINAAGNYGGCVCNGPINPDRHGYVHFGKEGLYTAVRFRNLLDENVVTITLTWNDYTDQEDAGTDKDLDLYVEDIQGRILGSSTLRQIKGDRPTGPGQTRNPRERVVLSDLAASADREYRIRVKARSSNFGSKDRLRILVSAEKDMPFRDPQSSKIIRPLQLLDASESGEIYPPADHAGVITVGDGSRYSSLGPTADGRIKPDVVIADSTALLSSGEETKGSSNAAAYFAGIVTVLKAVQPTLQTRHLLALAHRGEPQPGSTPPGLFPGVTPRPPEQLQRLPRSQGAGGPPVAPRMPPPRVPWRTPSQEKLGELIRWGQ